MSFLFVRSPEAPKITKAQGCGISISQRSTPLYSGSSARWSEVLSTCLFISGFIGFRSALFYQRVPIRGEPLHALIGQVVTDIVLFPFFCEINIPVGDAYHPLRVVAIIRRRDGKSLL